MYVLRTTRKRLPIFQDADLDKVLEIYYARIEKYGKDKFEILDCIKEELLDVESIETRHFDGGDTGVSESVSEDTDFSLYGALGDTTESSSESPD